MYYSCKRRLFAYVVYCSCGRILLLLILLFVLCFMAAFYVAHLISVHYGGQQHQLKSITFRRSTSDCCFRRRVLVQGIGSCVYYVCYNFSFIALMLSSRSYRGFTSSPVFNKIWGYFSKSEMVLTVSCFAEIPFLGLLIYAAILF